MSEHPHVKLGKHSLPAYEQPWRRVVKRLGRVFDSFQAATADVGELDTTALVRSLQVSGNLYAALETFLPKLPEFLPEYEFNGFTSPEAWREDRYDEDDDPSPTFPQFIEAFDTIIAVNGGKRFLDMLGKVFDPKMLRAEMSLALSEWRESRSIGSPSSPGTSGASLPSASTTTGPTPEQSSGSSGIESLDFVPRTEWMPEPSGAPLTT